MKLLNYIFKPSKSCLKKFANISILLPKKQTGAKTQPLLLFLLSKQDLFDTATVAVFQSTAALFLALFFSPSKNLNLKLEAFLDDPDKTGLWETFYTSGAFCFSTYNMAQHT